MSHRCMAARCDNSLNVRLHCWGRALNQLIGFKIFLKMVAGACRFHNLQAVAKGLMPETSIRHSSVPAS